MFFFAGFRHGLGLTRLLPPLAGRRGGSEALLRVVWVILQIIAVVIRAAARLFPTPGFSLTGLLRGERCALVIPWEQISKIGDDVILVSVDESCFAPGR